MGSLRVKDLTPAELRRMSRMPMGPLVPQDAAKVNAKRGELKPNERWESFYYINSRYSVQVSTYDTGVIGEMIHLWIRRHDGEMPSSWSDMQAIKNQCAGRDRVGVEVFPEHDRLIDQANMAHLWIYPEGHVLPFTLG